MTSMVATSAAELAASRKEFKFVDLSTTHYFIHSSPSSH